MAALMHFVPQFSNEGGSELPRARGPPNGWRRRARSRSRTAYLFQVWAGICSVLAMGDHSSMAVYVL